MHVRSVAAVSSIAVLCACAPETPVEVVEDAVGTLGQPIEGGYLDDSSTAVVGMVHFAQGNFGACSGTLIAPNVVLTAGHCVAQPTTEGVNCSQTKFGAPYPATTLAITTTTSFTQNPSNYYRGSEVMMPPGGDDFCGRDQALLILEEPVPASEAVPRIPRVDSSLERYETYYAIGYGAQNGGSNAPSGTRFRRDNLLVQCVASDCPEYYVTAEEWEGETGVCQGDSGGPALDLQDRVVGVASRGAAGCESPVYGHVFAWGDWIKETVLYASTSAGLEPPAWAEGFTTDPNYYFPVGDECSVPEDCPSNACLDGICTRICSAEGPCPEGFVCSGDGWCEKIPEPESAAPSDDSQSDIVATCALGTPTKDPTKPIPWIVAGAALFLFRRRRH